MVKGSKRKRSQTPKARAASLRNLKKARASRGGRRARASMPKKGGRRGGRRAKRMKKGGHRRGIQVMSVARPISKVTGAIEAFVEGVQAGDLKTGLVQGAGALTGNLTGYNAATNTWEPERLSIGYGPAAVVEGINYGFGFVRKLFRGFGVSGGNHV